MKIRAQVGWVILLVCPRVFADMPMVPPVPGVAVAGMPPAIADKMPVAVAPQPVATTQKVAASDTAAMPPAPAEVAPRTLEPGQKIDVELVPPECVPSGLNTVGDSGGNWLLKRGIWEQAWRMLKKIESADAQLYEDQLKYVSARNEVDRILDAAFRQLGFDQGQLFGLLDALQEDLKREQERQGSLDIHERQLAQTIKDKQREVQQLQADLKAIDALDDAVDKTVEQVGRQLNVCHDLKRRALQHYESIANELNDRAATVLFYEMDGYLKTVEQNVAYIGGPLMQYMDENIGLIKQHLQQISSKVDGLKGKGTDLAQELRRLTKKDDAETLARVQKEKEEAARAAAEKALRDAQEARKKASLWYRIQDQWHRVWTAVAGWTHSAWRTTAGWFGFGRAKTAA